MSNHAAIPMKVVGPILITGPDLNEAIRVPLATFETPLWPSVNRGAKISRECGGIAAVIIDDRMTRSILLEAENATQAHQMIQTIKSKQGELGAVVSQTSHYASLLDLHDQIVGRLIYLRLEFSTGDASGHNMVTKAADAIIRFLLEHYPLKYVSISGNYCTDKKVSAVNGILGRGKYAIAEMNIPRIACEKILKTTPEKIVEMNIKKNLIGTMLAGGVRSANAHFANILLAIYLASGQDAANIIEGSQGFVHTEVQSDQLYFSVTLPNIIVGTVGNGKNLDFVQENLQLMGCLTHQKSGMNARRLALITAATVLCGELSLLAAQTNPGELMKSHLILERT